MYKLSEDGLKRKREAVINANGYKLNLLDYHTGEIIDTYKSIKEAAFDNYIDIGTLGKALKKNNGIVESRKLRFQRL